MVPIVVHTRHAASGYRETCIGGAIGQDIVWKKFNY